MGTFFGRQIIKGKKTSIETSKQNKREMRKYILYKCGTNRETKKHKITRK